MRAGVYTRISSKDPKVPKVEPQEADCRALCARETYSVERVYVDDGISAASFKDRPGWREMLADIAAGRLDVLVATEEERFTRQVMEKETLQLACVQAGVKWHTVRGGKVDPATADGEFFSTMRGAMGRMESRRKGERQRTANRHRRVTGEPLKVGPRPFGYEADKKTIRKDEADLIRWATAHVIANNGGMYAVERRFNESGIAQMRGTQGWTHSSLRSLLMRGRNAGIVEHGEIQVDPVSKKERVVRVEAPGVVGKWESIVSREDLLAVRQILARAKGKKGSRTYAPTSLLGGIARCACGAKMIRGHTVGRGVRREHYRCSRRGSTAADANAGHASIAPHTLEPMVIDNLFALYLESPADAAGVAGKVEAEELAALYERKANALAAQEDILDIAEKRGWPRGRIDQRLARLDVEIAQADADIASAIARSANAAMVATAWAELDKLPADLVGQTLVDVAERLNRPMDKAVGAVQLLIRWSKLDLTQQRNLVRSLLKITVHPGRGQDRVQIERAQVRGSTVPV